MAGPHAGLGPCSSSRWVPCAGALTEWILSATVWRRLDLLGTLAGHPLMASLKPLPVPSNCQYQAGLYLFPCEALW